MERDDLPPKRETDVEDRSFFESLGELFGASIWIALFLVIVGGGFYLFIRATH